MYCPFHRFAIPRFHRERLVQKLLIEMFLHIVDEDNSHSVIIKLWTSGTPHHLQHIYSQIDYSTTLYYIIYNL